MISLMENSFVKLLETVDLSLVEPVKPAGNDAFCIVSVVP